MLQHPSHSNQLLPSPHPKRAISLRLHIKGCFFWEREALRREEAELNSRRQLKTCAGGVPLQHWFHRELEQHQIKPSAVSATPSGVFLHPHQGRLTSEFRFSLGAGKNVAQLAAWCVMAIFVLILTLFLKHYGFFLLQNQQTKCFLLTPKKHNQNLKKTSQQVTCCCYWELLRAGTGYSRISQNLYLKAQVLRAHPQGILPATGYSRALEDSQAPCRKVAGQWFQQCRAAQRVGLDQKPQCLLGTW